MGIVISILNSKGGSGKTTLSTNLAGSLHRRGFSVLVVDSDPQGTARDWHHAQPDDIDLPAVVGIDRPTLHKDIPRIAGAYDFVVIDGAARLEQMSASALRSSDLVMIPVQPSGFDLWAVRDLVEMVETRQGITEGKPQAVFVVSRQIQRTSLAAEIHEAATEMGLPILAARTSQRVAYAEAGQSGMTVLDLDPCSKASAEIEAITDEVLNLIQQPKA